MRYRRGGVGHLATWQCNKTLLADEHTVLADPDEPTFPVPVADPTSDEDSDSEVGESDNEDRDRDLTDNLDDSEIVDMAGFRAL
jgi:hypothetical protein